jgi:hypothetical protein
VVLWNGSLVFLDWNGSLAFLDDVIVGCWDSYEDGTGDELKGRSVTKDGAKSTDLSDISSQIIGGSNRTKRGTIEEIFLKMNSEIKRQIC